MTKYLDMTSEQLEGLEYVEGQVANAMIETAMSAMNSEYPELTEDDYSRAVDNAVQSPCEGMSFLDLYGGSLEGIRMDRTIPTIA